MQPGFAKLFASLQGTQVKNLTQLVQFNQEHSVSPSSNGLCSLGLDYMAADQHRFNWSRVPRTGPSPEFFGVPVQGCT